MNILDGLIDYVWIDDKRHKIDTSFKKWERLYNAFKRQDDIADIVRLIQDILIDLEVTEANIEEIHKEFISFIVNAKSYIYATPDGDNSEPTRQVKDHDIELDSNYIYGAFLEQYGIDLIDTDLHYHKYIALRDCLSYDTLFKKIVGYRTADITKIKDETQKREANRLYMLFKLPDDKPEELTQEEIEHNLKWSLHG